MKSRVGQGIDRVDARDKVTGRAVYAAEVPVARVAHGVIVTSAVAAASVIAIDTKAAERVAGVLSVLTHENAPKVDSTKKDDDSGRVLQLLQEDQVHYADQPIAMVVAETLEAARTAAALIRVQYSGATPLIHLEQSSDPGYAPQRAGHGPTDTHTGDFERAFAAARTRVTETYTTPIENHNPMEMHATIAVWRGEDRLTVYDSTQGIFGVRKKLAQVFGLDPAKVRVISKYVGGGFGCKGSCWSHVPLTALAARVVGRPVKTMLTRQQMFALVGHRPRTSQQLSLGAAADGRLLAVRHQVISETSRFDEFVEPSADPTRMLYACGNISTSHRLKRLDIPTPTFMRAPGKSSGSFALESALDELSYALGLDPLTLRLKNYAERDPDSGKPWSSKSLRACYEQAATRFGWARRPKAVRATREGPRWIGWGMASSTYPAIRGKASARLELRQDGSLLAEAGSQDIGTGTYTIMTQIAADAVGIELERVRFDLGDTSLPETPVSGGSQTAASVGSAVQKAGENLRAELARLSSTTSGSPLFGVDPAQIEAENGALFDKRKPDRRLPFSDLLKLSQRPKITVEATSEVGEGEHKVATHSFGAQFAEVSVDEELGEIRVQRLVGAFGCGKILNAKTAHSQFLGGMVWGIGMALLEKTVRDARNGRAVTRDLADYHVPVHADIPPIDIIMVDEHDAEVNPIGAKGIGEIGIVGTAAAIANAVYHATGKRIRDLPITPDKLLTYT